MRIRGDFVSLIWREVVVERRFVGEKRFFFVGSSWCVSGFFYENFEIKIWRSCVSWCCFSIVFLLA